MRPYRRTRFLERLRRFGVLSSAFSRSVVSVSLALSRQLTGSVPMGIRADSGVTLEIQRLWAYATLDSHPVLRLRLGPCNYSRE